MRLLLPLALVACASQAEPPPAAPPAAASSPQPFGAALVAPSVLDARRVKGEFMISPDPWSRAEMSERGMSRVTYAAKVCISTTGKVGSIRTLESTGIPRYDLTIIREMSRWEYTPYIVDGRPVAACSSVTIIYNRR